MTSEVALDYAAEFHRDWISRENTPFEFPAVDLNTVLRDHYQLSEPFVLTRNMVWDMQVRKANDAETYLPGMVRPGTAQRWETGESDFVQVAEHRLWLDPDRYGLVIQRVHLDHERRAVLLLGTGHIATPEGDYLWAGTDQPLFHIEQIITGAETRPVLTRRIVHLTDEPDPRITAAFATMSREVWLRDMFEVYIRRDLGIGLTRRELSAA